MAQMNHEFIARKVSGNSFLVKQLSGENFYNERKEDAKYTLVDKGLQSLKQNTNCAKSQSSLWQLGINLNLEGIYKNKLHTCSEWPKKMIQTKVDTG